MRRTFSRFRELSVDERRLLWRAALNLTAASIVVALLPFRVAIRLGSIPLAWRRGVTVDTCVWAVEAAARRMPWRPVCIHKAIATQRMLRAAGEDALLHYGARHDPISGKLEAHVWVSVGGQLIVGGEEAKSFGQLAVYS